MAPFSSKTFNRVELPISKKLEVINYAKVHGYKEAAAHFGIGKTTALLLSRSEDELKKLDEVNMQMGSVRMRRFKQTDVLSINVKTWKWLKEKMERGEPISDKLIREKALSFAHDESVLNFSASNGWLVGFKKRHGVRLRRTSSSSSNAHAKTHIEPSNCSNEKAITKEPSPEVSSEANLHNHPVKARWMRIHPEDIKSIDLSKPRNENLQSRNSISQGTDLSYLMDPRYNS